MHTITSRSHTLGQATCAHTSIKRVHTSILDRPIGGKVFIIFVKYFSYRTYNLDNLSSLGRYVFGSEISYNKAPPRLPGLAC
jgi:hypothetical protein